MLVCQREVRAAACRRAGWGGVRCTSIAGRWANGLYMAYIFRRGTSRAPRSCWWRVLWRRQLRAARSQSAGGAAQLEHRRWTLWWNAAHIQEEQWVSCRAATVGCRHDGCILGFPHWARWSAGAVVASPGLPRTRSSAERCRPCLREIRNRLQRGFARQLGLGLLGAGLERIWTGMGIAGTCGVSGGIASEHTRVRADIYVCRRR